MSDAALETLRQDAARFFERLAEPPVYRRPEDPAWQRARALLPGGAELLTRARSDDVRAPVFDRNSGFSRVDPRPEPALQVELVCMDVACRSVSAFSVGARQSTHRLECLRCRQPFLAFFGEAARMRREEKSRQRRYVFAVREPGGGQARVEFKDAGSEPFEAVHGDLLAFLCTPERTVRGVTNLTTNRTFWVTRGGVRNGW